MLSQKSIRTKFALQLAVSSTMLVVVFAIMTYQLIKINIYQSQTDELISQIKQTLLTKNKQSINIDEKNPYIFTSKTDTIDDMKIKKKYKLFSKNSNDTFLYFVEQYEKDNKVFLRLSYPYNQNEQDYESFIITEKDITSVTKIINQILFDIVTVATFTIVLIIFYALFLSRILLSNLKILNKKLKKLDENFLKPLKENDLPKEFSPVIKTINQLTNRIQTFVSSQKELFIGIAHELKTPLAIMKSSNDVTLIKEREIQRYIDTLKECNNSIDKMNKMISAILQIGREEGAQFEEAQEIDIVKYIEKQCKNFIFLCTNGKTIKTNLTPTSLYMKIQPTLLTHILQNFVQNAIKFSPDNSVININSFIENKHFFIEVVDNGCGVNDNMDLFAPFKRYGDKNGVGLGLFLAKNAAQAMKAEIYLNNNKNTQGCTATLKLRLTKEE